VTRRAGALVAIAALCSLGCFGTTPDGDPDPPGGTDPDLKGDGDTASVPEAYFILQETDLSRPDWPGAFTRYSMFVCNPGMSASEVARIHQDVPGVVALAYTNYSDLPLGIFPGSPYFDSLDARFDSTLCVIDLVTGNVIRMEIGTADPWPHCVLRQASADALVAFHRDITMAVDWDGVYVDNCTAVYPPWRSQNLLEATTEFDANGDGIADRVEDVEAQYATWRPYYTQHLREALGDAIVMVANAGGPLTDGAFNGITLEGVGTRFAVDDAREFLLEQRAVSRLPFLSALWVTSEESREPSLELARQINGVYYGSLDTGP
jgi:hypothetical protein